MCGIVGIVGNDAKENIKRLTDAQAHRGPDDYGYFVEDNLAFGHRRLSIMDVSSNGHQPMMTADENLIIIFNGEIYNHLELRENLISKYTFKSKSDTETILYGFKEYGVKFFNMMNGIFALSIFNKETKDLIVARDHFGVKPLYYFSNSETLIFASELKSLTLYDGLPKDIDYQALSNYVNFLWCPGEKTPLKNVKKLLPGHYLQLNTGKLSSISTKKYYEIPFDGEYFGESEEVLIEELDKLLEAAVKRQLLADVPVGYFLSGGLDSSLIVAYGRKIDPNKKIDCFTINTSEVSTTEGFSDDLMYAKLVAAHLKVDLNIVEADIEIVRDFDKMIYHLDEPQADAAPLNVLNICSSAREMGYKVLLGGTAGDDLFSGYRRHQVLEFEKYYQFVPSWLGRPIKAISLKLNANNSVFRRIRKALLNIDKTKIQRMVGYFSWIPLAENNALFSKKAQASIGNADPGEYLVELLKNIPKEHSDLNKMLYWEMKSFLVDHNLNYTDKLSMAVGVETRVPFLDVELVKFSTKIPPHLKLKGNTTKYLLKKVAERYLPKEVIYRSKAGFGAPVRKWITEDMDQMIQERLSAKSINEQGIFDAEAVHSLIKKNKEGKIDASYTIWCLLAINSWYSQFVKSKQ